MRARLNPLILMLVCLAGALAVGAPGSSGAARQPATPYVVGGASVVQSGQRIVWTTTFSSPFVAPQPRARRASACLLVQRARGSAAVTGQLCVIAAARAGGSPRVVYQAVSGAAAGPAHVVNAAVSGSGTRRIVVALGPGTWDSRYAPFRWQVRTTLRARGCVPAGPSALGCVRLFPRAARVAALHEPVLAGCVADGAFVSHGPAAGREIALTFDDGPWSDTPGFLSVLEHYHAPATFFEVGEHIAQFGQGGAIERRMLADGDMIGDHTWSHVNVAAGGPLAVSQISQAAAAIKAATGGFSPCLFRAPYGAVGPGLLATAKSLGFDTIQWDIDPRDWAMPGTEAIVSNVLANAHPGAIVISHDGGGNRSQTLAALPQEIEGLRARGYRLVTVTQLLGLRLVYR